MSCGGIAASKPSGINDIPELEIFSIFCRKTGFISTVRALQTDALPAVSETIIPEIDAPSFNSIS